MLQILARSLMTASRGDIVPSAFERRIGRTRKRAVRPAPAT